MGNDNPRSNIKPINLHKVATFKQNYGETLKDAWGRINKIQNEDLSPCSEENLQLYFYYGLEPWYQNALDVATGGSFTLSTHIESERVLKNLFGSFTKTKEVEDIIHLLTATKLDIETCANKLPNKEDLKCLESLTSTHLPSIENKMNTILHKLDLCEKEFTMKDDTLSATQKKSVQSRECFENRWIHSTNKS